MSLNVFYTPAAKETLSAVYLFIQEKFGVRSAEKFLVKAEKSIALISEHPLMFKASQFDESVRIAVISKQTSLFYQVTKNSVNLLFFWDNRQEPMMDSL